jgi:cytoskeleton protein RodZ
MSDVVQAAAAPPGASAGTLLRDAREAMGLPIEELASMLKVAPGKIESLEADRHNEFPDPVFARALAQSLCRTLKIDAVPVLALLPKTPGQRLDKIHVGLNAQYREGPAPLITDDWSGFAKPLLWGPALLVVAAALIYFFPTGWLNPPKVSPRLVTSAPAASSVEPSAAGAPASAPAGADAVQRPEAPQAPVVAATPASPATVSAAPPPSPAPAPALVSTPAATADAPAPAPAVQGVLQFRTSADSWIEVQDARGVMLLSRGLEAGESVGLNGAMPLKVTIGNVRATQVTFRGKAMDLALFTRDNIARFELK